MSGHINNSLPKSLVHIREVMINEGIILVILE